MLEYIKGKLVEINPTVAILDNVGLGYFLNISLNTYSAINGEAEITLFVHEAIREDAYVLYGFATIKERTVFRQLISVSGIGANTARLMLSKLTPQELESAIATGNVNVLKGIKGIGAKSAQRVIVDLKDKIGKNADEQEIFSDVNNNKREETLSALIMLGFPKNSVEKLLDALIIEMQNESVEAIIKAALKRL